MTFSTDDLVKVEHPGDADIWHSFDISIVNGEEVFSNSQLYWEESDGNLVALKAGDGRGLPLEGWVGYGYDCSTPYEFTSAWVQTNGKLRTFGNQVPTDYDCGPIDELVPDPEKGSTVRTVEHRGGVKGNAGGGSSYWIEQGDDDLFFYEKKYELDINGDEFVGYIAPNPNLLIVDQGIYEKPAVPILLESDFVETYKGTSQDDSLIWDNDFSESSLLIQAFEGNDSISSYGNIDNIAADGGSGKDSISITLRQNATAIGGAGADVISMYEGYPYNTGDLSGAIHSGDDDDTISVSDIEYLELVAGAGDDIVSTTFFESSLSDNVFSGLIWLEEGDDQYERLDEYYLSNEISDLEIENIQVVVFGGDGNDRLNGKQSYDYQPQDVSFERANGILFGEEGNDQLSGFYVNGGNGDDMLNGSIVELSSGNDTIEGFKYHQGDSLVVNSDLFGKTLTFNYDEDDLRISSETGINTLLANPFESLPFDIKELQKSVYYLDGSDDLSGGENPDGGIGGSPDPGTGVAYKLPETTSTVEGTNGKDKLRGKRSNDLILGLDANDKLNGKKGDDILEGGEGNDTLNGKKGDDYLLGSQGSDILNGGKGADVFKISKGVDVVNDFKLQQGDRVGLNQGTEYEVIDDVDGTLIKVSDDIRMILLDQDYDEFLAAGNDAIARIAF